MGWGGGGCLPEVDEGAEDARGYSVVGGEVGVVLVAGLEVLRGDEARWCLRRGSGRRDAGVSGRDLCLGMISGSEPGWGCRRGPGFCGLWG